MMIFLQHVVAMLVVGSPSADSFSICARNLPCMHPHHKFQVRDSNKSEEKGASIGRSIRTLLFSTPSKSSTTHRKNSSSNKPKRKKNIQPTARFVAISALASADGSFATRELEQSSYYKQLEARDRAFARLLVATVERRLVQIDTVLKSCIAKNYPPKKGKKHSNIIQATLRIGVAQLVFLHTPPFAAIKETVEVLRMDNPHVPEPMIKFVNGVLRNLSRPPDDGTTEMLGEIILKEKTSSRDNIAPWLIEKWQHDWGMEKAALICEEMIPYDDSSQTTRIDLSTKYSTKYSMGAISGTSEHQEKLQTLMTSLGDDCTLLPHGSIRVGQSLKGDVKMWPEYEDGTWWVQDASSALPALVLTSALYDKHSKEDIPNIRVVDMCSAPGGKTSQLASADFGHITAIEASPRRSRRLKENLERLGLLEKCEVVVQEGQHWLPQGKVHGVLVDVPCTATGTGARRPDVLRRSDNFAELLQTQEMLANHCADNILDVGGILIYATCSILKDESEEQVQKLINRGNVETLPILSHEVPGFESAIDSNGFLRVLPGVMKGELKTTDGFFVARLVRK